MTNPFHALYASEKVTPDEFVRLFSPRLVAELAPLYRPGNIVLRGMQGSGKTMLLDLLTPEVRVAYHNAGIPFPVGDDVGRFLGCGINLVRSRAFEFGQRAATKLADNSVDIGILFGDFVNYWLTLDLLRGIRTLCSASAGLDKNSGVVCDPTLLDDCAREIANSKVWFGYLDGVRTYEELDAQIETRLSDIRRWVNRNRTDVPDRILSTRTSAGEPLSEAVGILKKQGVVSADVNVFVRIDQYEELHYLAKRLPTGADTSRAMQSTIHKMMGVRDARLSYRVGARLFAWPEHPVRLAGEAPLELKRDYDTVDLENALRRQENTNQSYFPEFARDIFKRRLETAGISTGETDGRALMRAAFGITPTKREKARSYVGPGRRRPKRPSGPWQNDVGDALRAIALDDPYEGILAEAWSRSRSAKSSIAVTDIEAAPWRGYWESDRADQVSLQVAASAAQRMRWYGDDDIIRLSNANPLTFVTICKELFDSAERNGSQISVGMPGGKESPMPTNHQNEAIYEASETWYSKIAQSEGGRVRQEACIRIGEWARKSLRSDKTLSRPGHNGFSISETDLRSDPALATWLREAVDHAALVSSRHTSKSGPARLKFYLPPILCPRFQIPSTRRKEPKYISAETARRWLLEGDSSALTTPRTRSQNAKSDPSGQSEPNRLFP